MKLGKVVWSLDFILSIVIFIGTLLALPPTVKISYFISAYGMGITVLSIIFSLFVAALAIVLASSDDDYVLFLEERKVYKELHGMFRFTLFSLFVSLVYSIAAYLISNYMNASSAGSYEGATFFFSVFLSLFSYSMLLVVPALWHTLRFAEYRVDYLKIKKGLGSQPDGQLPKRSADLELDALKASSRTASKSK